MSRRNEGSRHKRLSTGKSSSRARIATLEAQVKDAQARILSIPAPLDEYHEDMRPVVWWAADENGVWLGEPAWIGKPDGSDWPGYHTHWTFHPQFPSVPARAAHVEPTAPDEVSRLSRS
ncbi:MULTISPECIES: hypothetical protein [Paraburkholderia]|uniref:hypothetical protein n=1 Tax=Paraburkholderia TaxID=1822464 RepID=UPI0013A6ACBC|nr:MULTISPECIES: hypothetical protein [Paraburkholderia]MDH6147310.1 hypothetical protein [Paraburkholderia sp. WSM4179]